jgi:hypothetical protein
MLSARFVRGKQRSSREHPFSQHPGARESITHSIRRKHSRRGFLPPFTEECRHSGVDALL